MLHPVLLQASPTIDPAAIVAALRGHQWTLVTAIALYALALVVKQGYAGPWLQQKLPPRALPFLSPVVSILFLSSGEVMTGTPWLNALVDGLVAGFLPLIGHEVVVESARGGKELIPEKKAAPPPANGGDTLLGKTVTIRTKTDPPGPPAAARTALRLSRVFALCLAVSTVTCMTGCASWQSFLNNPVSVARSLAEYVTTFLQTAQTVWALILPLLGSSAPAANTAFVDAVAALQAADAVLLDAARAAVVAQTPNPDFSQLMTNVEDAVQRVLAVIRQFQGAASSSAAIGDKADTLGHMALQVKNWGN